VFSGVFIAEEGDGVGNKGSRDTPTDTLGGLFEHVLENFHVSLMNLFLVKSKTYGLGTTLLSCQIVRISGLLAIGLKESLQFVQN
jgi:hypothetical protein